MQTLVLNQNFNLEHTRETRYNATDAKKLIKSINLNILNQYKFIIGDIILKKRIDGYLGRNPINYNFP